MIVHAHQALMQRQSLMTHLIKCLYSLVLTAQHIQLILRHGPHCIQIVHFLETCVNSVTNGCIGDL